MGHPFWIVSAEWLISHGVKSKSPFHTIAVSGWPFKAAMCINVLPSFVRSNTEALNLSGKWINQQYLFVLWTTSFRVGLSPARNSTVEVWPFSAARCMGVLNIRTSNVISYWAMPWHVTCPPYLLLKGWLWPGTEFWWCSHLPCCKQCANMSGPLPICSVLFIFI